MNHRAYCCYTAYSYSLALLMWSVPARTSFVSSFVTVTTTRTSATINKCQKIVLQPFTSSSSSFVMRSAAEDTMASPSEAGVDIAANLKEVRQLIETSCKESGRSADAVRLVAVR